jgi:hypothetical protein
MSSASDSLQFPAQSRNVSGGRGVTPRSTLEMNCVVTGGLNLCPRALCDKPTASRFSRRKRPNQGSVFSRQNSHT